MNALSHKDLPRLPKRGRPTLNEGKKRDVPLKSLDNALLVLNELANHGPLSLSDLARRTEFSVPTTHRILSTFAARGYVVLDEETQMWSFILLVRDICNLKVLPGWPSRTLRL